MDSRLKIFFAAVAVALSLTLVSFSAFVQAPKPFYGFSILMPDIVEIAPGGQQVIHGGVLNFGYYWEHNVVVNITGLPSGFSATPVPDHFENLRTLRDWNPDKGLFYVPENLSIILEVPANAVPGVYTANISMMDMQSARHYSNYTVFIVRVSGQMPNPQISISDISVPDSVQGFTPFNVSFSVVNSANSSQHINLTLAAPRNWNFTPSVISDTLNANSSKEYFFQITPTNESGQFSVVINYPYSGVVLNVTKTGPQLTIGGGGIFGLPKLPNINLSNISLPSAPISGSAVSQVYSFALANPLITVVVIVVIAVLLYYFYTSYTAGSSRRKPEEMSKQTELAQMKNKITSVDTSNDSSAVSSA